MAVLVHRNFETDQTDNSTFYYGSYKTTANSNVPENMWVLNNNGASWLVNKLDKSTYTPGADYRPENDLVVKIKMFQFDSHDGENFWVWAGGSWIYLGTFSGSNSDHGTTKSGTGPNGITWEMQTEAAGGNYMSTTWDDEVHYITINIPKANIPTNDDYLDIGFYNTLDQGTNDESWGIGSVTVYENNTADDDALDAFSAALQGIEMSAITGAGSTGAYWDDLIQEFQKVENATNSALSFSRSGNFFQENYNASDPGDHISVADLEDEVNEAMNALNSHIINNQGHTFDEITDQLWGFVDSTQAANQAVLSGSNSISAALGFASSLIGIASSYLGLAEAATSIAVAGGQGFGASGILGLASTITGTAEQTLDYLPNFGNLDLTAFDNMYNVMSELDAALSLSIDQAFLDNRTSDLNTLQNVYDDFSDTTGAYALELSEFARELIVMATLQDLFDGYTGTERTGVYEPSSWSQSSLENAADIQLFEELGYNVSVTLGAQGTLYQTYDIRVQESGAATFTGMNEITYESTIVSTYTTGQLTWYVDDLQFI